MNGKFNLLENAKNTSLTEINGVRKGYPIVIFIILELSVILELFIIWFRLADFYARSPIPLDPLNNEIITNIMRYKTCS